LNQNEKNIENAAVSFLYVIYKTTPIDVLNQWGIKRYIRFKTEVWKGIESSDSLQSFLGGYFRYYPVSTIKIVEYLDTIPSDKQDSVFKYLKQNLPILIGRMQVKAKAEKEETENNYGVNIGLEMETRIDI